MAITQTGPIDPIPDLKLAWDLMAQNMNKHEAFNNGALGLVMSRLPMLIEEAEAARKQAKENMGYAVVIHDPDNDAIVESQGAVKVFYVDLGGIIDTGNAMEVDAVEAMEQAAEYARQGDAIPEGAVQSALYGAVDQIMEAYGEFKEAAERLSVEDKAALSDWLRQETEVRAQAGSEEDEVSAEEVLHP